LNRDRSSASKFRRAARGTFQGDGASGRFPIAVAAEKDSPEAQALAHCTTAVITDAGRHFNRGQRAFFFALGYLGWFIGPLPLIATTAGIVVVMWRRQFASESSQALRGA
jgi:uncharacterized membrane protein